MFRENTFLTKGAKKLESESALGAPATEPLMTLEDIEGRADTPINRVLEDQEEKVAALDEIQHLKLIYNIADRLKIKPVDAQDLVAQATKTPDGEINFELVIKYYNRETSDLLQKDPKFEEFYKDYLKEQLILKKLEWEVQNKASYEPR
ncbi:MAG: hypothetical protein NT091_01630, partial [Candidatus Falkowbacteria bacterium]|nr:hypothetical protein [Candidatus Falkowbacteria bacterium]